MAQISFRIDDELKRESEQVFRSIGMNMTTAFNVFLRQAVKTQGIPFNISAKEKNNLDYMKKIDDSAESLKSGKGIVFTMDELTALETMSAEEARDFIEKRKAEHTGK
jgi:DNA-damage-inducible protein J